MFGWSKRERKAAQVRNEREFTESMELVMQFYNEERIENDMLVNSHRGDDPDRTSVVINQMVEEVIGASFAYITAKMIEGGKMPIRELLSVTLLSVTQFPSQARSDFLEIFPNEEADLYLLELVQAQIAILTDDILSDATPSTVHGKLTARSMIAREMLRDHSNESIESLARDHGLRSTFMRHIHTPQSYANSIKKLHAMSNELSDSVDPAVIDEVHRLIIARQIRQSELWPDIDPATV